MPVSLNKELPENNDDGGIDHAVKLYPFGLKVFDETSKEFNHHRKAQDIGNGVRQIQTDMITIEQNFNVYKVFPRLSTRIMLVRPCNLRYSSKLERFYH
jgi:hypothetical protein